MRPMRNVLFLGSVMSLAACGGNALEAFEAEGLAPSGVFLAVAAGNDNGDACIHSPAGNPSGTVNKLLYKGTL